MAEDKNLVIVHNKEIQSMIYTFRGRQVMLDSDLAMLYQVTTSNLNKAMKRNIARFPERFCFQLTENEYENLRFQNGISSLTNNYGGRRYMPYVFTEQGIAMLSAVLKSDIALEVSLKIMDSFVEMRKFLISNQELFSRLDKVELRQIDFEKKIDSKNADTDKKLEEVFDYIATTKEVKQKIFFNGQIYDAFSLIVEIVEKAKKSFGITKLEVEELTKSLLAKVL